MNQSNGDATPLVEVNIGTFKMALFWEAYGTCELLTSLSFSLPYFATSRFIWMQTKSHSVKYVIRINPLSAAKFREQIAGLRSLTKFKPESIKADSHRSRFSPANTPLRWGWVVTN